MSANDYFINLWVTMKCNFRCRYCYVKPMYSEHQLEREDADKFIGFIHRTILPDQNLILNFHGGEPLLNYDIIKYIIQKLKEDFPDKILRFGMTTNASLLDDEKIAFIAENMSFNCSVSIDGKSETMKMNRKCIDGDIDYDIILNNAKKLLNYNRNIRIRMTYDKKNVKSLFDNIKFFVENGFKKIVPVADEYASDWNENDFSDIREQFILLRKWMKEKEFNDINIEMLDGCFKELGRCTAGEHYYSIDVFGNIYPCTVLIGNDDWRIGTVEEGIYEGALDRIRKINSVKIEECLGCGLYRFCKSTRCRFINYATTRDYYKPNLVCCNILGVKMNLC